MSTPPPFPTLQELGSFFTLLLVIARCLPVRHPEQFLTRNEARSLLLVWLLAGWYLVFLLYTRITAYSW